LNAWADTRNFFGHFELRNHCGANAQNDDTGQTVQNSTPDTTWLAGGKHFTFSPVHFMDCSDLWTIIAWEQTGPNSYANIGEKKNFKI
jgi:hypothetical protein